MREQVKIGAFLFLLIFTVGLAACSDVSEGGQQRFAEVAATVTEAMSDVDNPKWKISLVDVDRPKVNWCSAVTLQVRTCGSARPKRDLYWLEITCAGRPSYIATYDRAFPDSLLLQSVNAEHACYKNR